MQALSWIDGTVEDALRVIADRAVASRALGGVIKAGERPAWADELRKQAGEGDAAPAGSPGLMDQAGSWISKQVGDHVASKLREQTSSPVVQNSLTGGLVGAGVGALGGMAANMMSRNPRKRPISNALFGGLVGGLGGAALGGTGTYLGAFGERPKAPGSTDDLKMLGSSQAAAESAKGNYTLRGVWNGFNSMQDPDIGRAAGVGALAGASPEIAKGIGRAGLNSAGYLARRVSRLNTFGLGGAADWTMLPSRGGFEYKKLPPQAMMAALSKSTSVGGPAEAALRAATAMPDKRQAAEHLTSFLGSPSTPSPAVTPPLLPPENTSPTMGAAAKRILHDKYPNASIDKLPDSVLAKKMLTTHSYWQPPAAPVARSPLIMPTFAARVIGGGLLNPLRVAGNTGSDMQRAADNNQFFQTHRDTLPSRFKDVLTNDAVMRDKLTGVFNDLTKSGPSINNDQADQFRQKIDAIHAELRAKQQQMQAARGAQGGQ